MTFPAAKFKMSDYHQLDADVIIIGAGVSGMTTAYALLEKEPALTVLILEATDRIGGRTISYPIIVKNELCVFDMGGQWICSQQKLLLDLLKKLGIQTEKNQEKGGKVIVDYDGTSYTQTKPKEFTFGNTLDKLELAKFVKKIEALCGKESLDPGLTSMTMEQFIDDNLSRGTPKAIIKSTILTYCGLDALHLSVAFYVFFCASTNGIVNQLVASKGFRELWIQNGAQEICNKIEILLQDEFTLLKDKEVIAITNNQVDVEIKTRTHTYYSTNVVVAIPPSAILKIKVTPTLPESKLQILRNAKQGVLVKFVATYEQAFWKKQGYCGDIYVLNNYDAERPLLCCFEVTGQNLPTLTGYTIKCGLKIRPLVLRQLSQYFGNPALQPLQFIEQDGGPMACYKSFEDVQEVKSNNGRIFWAGAETALEWYGCIHGAVHAGNRAAREVLYDMRPASLTADDMSYFRSSMSVVQKNTRTYDNIYQKIINPYYQLSLVVVLYAMYRMWRKGT